MKYDTLYEVLLMAEMRKIYKVFDANGEILFYGTPGILQDILSVNFLLLEVEEVIDNNKIILKNKIIL